MSYTGQLSNSISTKEDQLMHSNLIKDWKNGMRHRIPISGNFTVLKYINLTPQFDFTDRMYTNKIMRSWDTANQREVLDTVYGFHNVYNWSMSMSASTKLYGFFVPNRKIFGDKIIAIRHVITPQVSFSYAPDFGASRYGYYETYQRTDADGNVSLVQYSPYANSLYGVPGKGKTGSISWDVSNNIEMKIKSDDDSVGYKKISLIDELGFSMSYNMATNYHPLSDLSMRSRPEMVEELYVQPQRSLRLLCLRSRRQRTALRRQPHLLGNGQMGTLPRYVAERVLHADSGKNQEIVWRGR